MSDFDLVPDGELLKQLDQMRKERDEHIHNNMQLIKELEKLKESLILAKKQRDTFYAERNKAWDERDAEKTISDSYNQQISVYFDGVNRCRVAQEKAEKERDAFKAENEGLKEILGQMRLE